jgi:outer membrane autotransporter protein
LALLLCGGGAASAQGGVNCANPQAFPVTPTTVTFFNWGPSAVCAVAASTTSLTATLNNANTVFLTSTSAFVGSPPGQPNAAAGGLWVRGIGGATDVSSRGTFTVPANAGAFGPVSVDVKEHTSFAGVQAGADIARLNMGASGWNGHLGLTGGFLGTRGNDVIGTGNNTTDVPFVGIYGVLTHTSGFFSDFLLRWDWYSNAVTNAAVGLSGQSFGARAVSLTTSAGYRFALANDWFIEPSGGLIWSHADADPLFVPGGGPTGVPSGTITFDGVDSVLGRIGLRVGTTVSTPSMIWQPYAVVNLWREFADDATSQFNPNCGGCFPLNISASRVGTYGQFGLGLAAQIPQTGWLSYIRGDYRKGDNIEGWGLSVGLRYQWQEAGAAPLATKY